MCVFFFNDISMPVYCLILDITHPKPDWEEPSWVCLYYMLKISPFIPIVASGCLEAIFTNTSFQFGLAKCVLTCHWPKCIANRLANVHSSNVQKHSLVKFHYFSKYFEIFWNAWIILLFIPTWVPETISTPCLAWLRACTMVRSVDLASPSS